MSKKNPKIQRRIPRQARARQKYNAVLDACTQVLGREGYAKTTILELSLESGVAVPTIYQYFDNKDAIFLAWVNRVTEQVLVQVSALQNSMGNAALSEHIDALVAGALYAINQIRNSLHRLLSEVPQVLSSRLVASMEEKTLEMLQELFADQIQAFTIDNLEFKLRTLIRLITGYFLQAVLNGEREIDARNESVEIANLVKLYLAHSGLELEQ